MKEDRGADPRASGTRAATNGAATDESHYTIRVAPAVLATIVRQAAEQVPGVRRLATSTPGASIWRGGAAYAKDGLRLAVREGRVRVVVHLVVSRDHNLQAVGAAVQEAISHALESLVGMTTESIDVYVQSVD